LFLCVLVIVTEQTTDEAGIPPHFLLLLFLATEVGERVDDNAKYEVEYNDDDDEEEDQIIDNTCKEEMFLQRILYTADTHYKQH